MDFSDSWFSLEHFFVEHEMENFEDLDRIVERSLKLSKEELEREVSISPISHEGDDYFSEEYSRIADEIPNLVRGSLFIALYSYLESKLSFWCSQFGKRPNSIKKPVMTLEQSYSALNNILRCPFSKLIADPNQREFLNLMRDAIAHDHGYLSGNKLPRFRKLISKKEIQHNYSMVYLRDNTTRLGFEQDFISIMSNRIKESLLEVHMLLVTKMQKDR